MLNYWWVTRPKRKLDSVPEVLSSFAELALNQQWAGQRGTQLAYEEVLEQAGLKRVGVRRDQSGSGGRTYVAWLSSLGLLFTHDKTKQIVLTLAGEAIINGKSPVEILKNQVLKYQFPSAYSVGRNVDVSPRFRIRPFIFLLRLLSDDRLERYLTQSEIAKVVIVDAVNETAQVYDAVVQQILRYRSFGDACLIPNFLQIYKPSKTSQLNTQSNNSFDHLLDIANTLINWLEYTQLAIRNEKKQLVILDSKQAEVAQILSSVPRMIPNPTNTESFQRAYGLDPAHQKDNRNLLATQTITPHIIAEMKVKREYIRISATRPITTITSSLISEIANSTGIKDTVVETVLRQNYPHGSIGSFMASYFEMAFKGREECLEFEKASAQLFNDVFGYTAKHIGQSGGKSTPDILLLSDSDNYQAIIDTKAYSRYSIDNDHHNRMVHNYIKKISTYSSSTYDLGFFAYIAGGFCNKINTQIQSISRSSGCKGSGIAVTNFIKMVENQQNRVHQYSHKELRNIFGLNRQIMLNDL